MDDEVIVELFWQRSEAALTQAERAYASYCHAIAHRILRSHEDADECVNDTLARAWNAIPPARPQNLRTYLGRITRNLSLNALEKARAAKRGAGQLPVLLSELEECIPSSSETIDTIIKSKELARVIERWLSTLSADDRILFLRRYWFGDMVAALAEECVTTPNKLAGRLYRLRQRLKSSFLCRFFV